MPRPQTISWVVSYLGGRTNDPVKHIKVGRNDIVIPLCKVGTDLPPSMLIYQWKESSSKEIGQLPLCGMCEIVANRIKRDLERA